MDRRDFIQAGKVAMLASAAGTSAWWPSTGFCEDAQGWNAAAFHASTIEAAIRGLGGTGLFKAGKDIVLQAPEIAENGNVVRVRLTSQLDGTSYLAIAVDKNPNPLAAIFEVLPGVEANMAINIKMNQTSLVYGLAKVGDRYFYVSLSLIHI